MRQLPDDNLQIPVLIDAVDSSGSGFFVNTASEQYLVTAKHVLYKGPKEVLYSNKIELTCYRGDLKTQNVLTLDLSRLSKHIHIHPYADIVAVQIGSIDQLGKLTFLDGVLTPSAQTVGIGKHELHRFDDALVSNEIYVFGFPTSLANAGQIARSTPLLRRGIVAGKYFKNETLILDCHVYEGNSGGLVIEVEEHYSDGNYSRKGKAIGILTEHIPFIHSNHAGQENSGYCVAVPMDRLLELI